MAWFTLRYDGIAEFKRSWPGHGLPDSLHSVSVETASNGDLIDVEAYDEEGRPQDTRFFDGPAFAALTQDAIVKGDISE